MYRPSQSSVTRLPHAGVFASAGRALQRFRHKVAECCRQRRAYEELAAMSHQELEDIGISRSGIDAIFAGKYQRAKVDSPNVFALERCRYRERPLSTRQCNERRQ